MISCADYYVPTQLGRISEEKDRYYKSIGEGYCVYGFQSIVDPFWDEATSLRLFRPTPEDADFTLSMFNAALPRPLTMGFQETSYKDVLGRSTERSGGMVALPAYNELPSK